MKRSYIVILICCLICCSCKSKEEKANELIKQELSKSLYDFDSYEPIETIVNEAYQIPENDTTTLKMAYFIAAGIKDGTEKIDKANDARSHMEIWGAPTSYSSSYSDEQYYKYRREAQELATEALVAMNLVKEKGLALEDSIAKLDPKKQIGWVVTHKFRCKTRGGLSDLGNYRYIISKNFKEVLWQEDLDDDFVKVATEAFDKAKKKEFKDWGI